MNYEHEAKPIASASRLSSRKNKLQNNVIFHNRFVDLKELTEFIGAADLYVHSLSEQAQITSGTLAYAFAAGKAVISTRRIGMPPNC